LSRWLLYAESRA